MIWNILHGICLVYICIALTFIGAMLLAVEGDRLTKNKRQNKDESK